LIQRLSHREFGNGVMKCKVASLLFICAIAVVVGGCSGAPSVWDGRWELNELKSDFIGPTFSIAISPAGEYRVDNEAFGYSFHCDGKEYPTGSGHTTTCNQVSPLAIALKGRTNGALVTNTQWELSKDGKTLTAKGNNIQQDGSSKYVERAFERITASTGFAGRWRDTKPFDSQPKILVLALNHGVLHLEYPEIGQFSDAPVNGNEVAVHGPKVHPGTTYSVKMHDPHQFEGEVRFAGRTVRRSDLRLSNNGQTLFDESWVPGSSDRRDLLVFEKQ
jgi:hypothetical protein